MKSLLNVVLIQTHLEWESPKKNRAQLSKKIDSLSKEVDLIVLPEMFTTGFTMNAAIVSETMEGDTVVWMQKIAKTKNTAITGSLIIKEGVNYYNRLLFVEPSGYISKYDKRHTFTLAGENKVFTAGVEKVIINYKGWKICPLICYDLRFPVWARNIANYDILLYVANWPKPRISAWSILLKARAIENMSYCIGVNRIGRDASNNEYSGHSTVIDALGQPLTTLKTNEEAVAYVTLDKKSITSYRKEFAFLSDRDFFTIT